MENARKQKYCMGFAPLELTGVERITCRKFAAKNNQKELAKNDKITDIYNRQFAVPNYLTGFMVNFNLSVGF